jgi:AraC family transcriptional regulator of adaptative response / DNA-3-methyladenine glycosylase II
VRAVLGQQVTVTAEIGFSGKRVAAYGEPINDPAAVKLG